MEDQKTEQVGRTYEDKLVEERQGIDISMPDVEVVSKEASADENMEANSEEFIRKPSVISDEGNEGQVDYGTDWENETKKFQSMYDKQKADYDSLQSQVQQMRLLNLIIKLMNPHLTRGKPITNPTLLRINYE